MGDDVTLLSLHGGWVCVSHDSQWEQGVWYGVLCRVLPSAATLLFTKLVTIFHSGM